MSNQETIKFSDWLNFTPKQRIATEMADKYDYMLYGGAAGGGKSYWLRKYLIRWLIKTWKQTGIKGIVGGLFCEDYPALKDRHLSKMALEFPDWLGTRHADHKDYGNCYQLHPEWGGGVLAFRNLDDPSKYKSSEFAIVAVDELTKNKRETFDLLRSRKRWTGIEHTKFVAGTNPGEIGHLWVKKLWVDKQLDPELQILADQFGYVPATVDDNPYISQDYILTLESLPEKMRKALRYGNWDVFEGQFFEEWDFEQHVCSPFEIPFSWLKFRSIDPSGRKGITSCHWYALDHDKNVYCYREHYGTGLDADEHALQIAKASEGENYYYTVIDSAAFSKLGLPETIAEVYERCGVSGLVPSAKKREHGWNAVHQYLRWDKENPAKIKFFRICPNIIRTIPTLIHDKNNPQDVDSDCEDHAGDELRYFLQTLRNRGSLKPESPAEKKLAEYLLQNKKNNLDNFQYKRQ